jgi:hypothetical protein
MRQCRPIYLADLYHPVPSLCIANRSAGTNLH